MGSTEQNDDTGEERTMSLEKQMKTGQVYVEFGHTSPEDIAYEQ